MWPIFIGIGLIAIIPLSILIIYKLCEEKRELTFRMAEAVERNLNFLEQHDNNNNNNDEQVDDNNNFKIQM